MNYFKITPEISDTLRKVDIRAFLTKNYGCNFSGGNIKCPHPDHRDSNPSFSVWTKNGYYYWCCHGCHCSKKDLASKYKNYGTDFIALLRWLSDYKGSPHVLTFQEAAIKACEYAGISHLESSKNSFKQKLYGMQKSKALGCHNNLIRHPDFAPYKYLLNRGLDKEDIQKWMLGFNGKRITFPLFDRLKNVVAFSNRIVGNSKDEAKYVNSSSSDIFHKGEYLYGIHLLDPTLNYVFITEGQLDIIGANKYGLKNVLASLGTAFTKKHIETIQKYSNIKNIIFVFDGDEAGEKALSRSVSLARKAGLATSYVSLPEGMDLFDFSMLYKEKTVEEINNRISYYFYKELSPLVQEYDRIVFSLQSKILKKAAEIDSDLSENDEKTMLNAYMYSKFKMSYQNILGKKE